MTVEPLPKPKARTWLAAMRAKELEAIAYRQAHAKQAHALADKFPKSSFFPEKDCSAVCIPIGRLCPSEFPGCQDWEDYEGEDGNNQGKGKDNFSECLDWDADLEEQDRQNQEMENKKANEGKTPQNNLMSVPLTALTFQPPKSIIKWSKKGSNGNKCKMLAVEIGHKGSKSLKDVE